MSRGQIFASAIVAGVIVGTVLESALGRSMAIVVAVAVAAAIDAGGRRLHRSRPDDHDARAPCSEDGAPRSGGRRRRRR